MTLYSYYVNIIDMIFDNAFEQVGKEAVLEDFRRHEPEAGLDHIRVTRENAIHIGRKEVAKDTAKILAWSALAALGLYCIGETADQNVPRYQTPPSVEAPALPQVTQPLP